MLRGTEADLRPAARARSSKAGVSAVRAAEKCSDVLLSPEVEPASPASARVAGVAITGSDTSSNSLFGAL